jgi:hypothetical protein
MFTGQSLAANIDAKLPDNNNTSSFQVQNSANNVLIKVQSGGNVGVGVTPQSRFHINGTSWFQGDNTPLPPAAGKGIAIGSTGDLGYVFAFDYGTFTPQNLVLNHPGGNVGIGTVTPSGGRLHVETSSGHAVFAHTSSGGYGQNAVHGKNTGTNGSGVYGENTGAGGNGVTGSGSTGDGVYGFSTSGNGVRGSSTYSHGVYGESTTGWAGYFQGNVYVTGTVTQNSDVRLKQGVRTLSYGLHDVMQLRPVSYTWTQTSNRHEQLGLLAQEVEAVVPELVTTANDADQTKGINYIGLLPVMIKAMQEQQDIIAALNARVKALELALQQSRIQQQGD